MTFDAMFRNACVSAIAVLAGALAARAQESAKTVADGVYTDAQATRGATVYDAACACVRDGVAHVQGVNRFE